jgi:hypothetical protein
MLIIRRALGAIVWHRPRSGRSTHANNIAQSRWRMLPAPVMCFSIVFGLPE